MFQLIVTIHQTRRVLHLCAMRILVRRVLPLLARQLFLHRDHLALPLRPQFTLQLAGLLTLITRQHAFMR